ncbi:hypothetical protein BST61_g10556 [Cercospora zeina]
MPSTSNLLLLLLSEVTTIHAALLGPRYVNASDSTHASSTFSLPVIVTADPSISTDPSSAISTTSNTAVTFEETQVISDSAPAIIEPSSVASVQFSYVPGRDMSSQSTTGSSSRATISSNEPTSASIPPAYTEQVPPSTTSILFSYAPDTSSQGTGQTISTPSPGFTSSAVTIPQSTTFLTLYTTIYRANSGVAATADHHPLPSTAVPVSDLGQDSTTTMTIFTTVYAPASGGQSSTSGISSSIVATSLGVESSLAPMGSRPPATPDASSSSPTSSSTKTVELGPSSKDYPSTIAFTYAPGSTFATITKPHNSSPTSEEISTIQFSYAPGSTSPSSSAPPKSEVPAPSYTATQASSGSTEPSPSSTPSTPGGITIIPVNPNAATITITKTDACATQTVTETVAQMTVTITA